MPLATRILDQLGTTTNELTTVAIAWHVAILAIAVALFAGWRPSARHAAVLLILPLISVVMVSIAYSAWFNATSFALLALLLSFTLDHDAPRWRPRGPAWSKWLGIALVVYGFCYPHFVAGGWYRALYAAPVGLVPCPTLAVVVGFTLLGRANGSRATATVLAVWTTFYALFGIAVLGVALDVGLLVGALGLAALRRKTLGSSAPRKARLEIAPHRSR